MRSSARIEKAEGMHDDLPKQAKLLTSTGAEAMAAVREVLRRDRAHGGRRALAAAEVPGDALPGVSWLDS